MSQLTKHIDEFTLLRLVAGDLEGQERREASTHLTNCLACQGDFRSLEGLDADLRRLAKSGELKGCLDAQAFEASDPFRRRPPLRHRRRPSVLPLATGASTAGLELSPRILEELDRGLNPSEVLGRSALETGEGRFALFYALQSCGHRIAENPGRSLDFATAVLDMKVPEDGDDRNLAENLLSWSVIKAQAHSLAAQAQLWLKEYEGARINLVAAYRGFASEGDETAVAMVEIVESQRRFFLGNHEASLSLARRARGSLEGRGLDDLAARASVAEGMALAAGGRFADALTAYREALPVFERLGLWSNYVGALNSLATSLYRMGRLDEARREFARVFRRFSHREHRSWLGYVRHGLGDILFAAGRYREAATSFLRASQLFEECGLHASALSTAVREAESWARVGSVGRANTRLASVASAIARENTLDPTVRETISRALVRLSDDSSAAAAIQDQLESLLRSS